MTLDLDRLREAYEHFAGDPDPLPTEADEIAIRRLMAGADLLLGAEKRWECVEKDINSFDICTSDAPHKYPDCGWRLSLSIPSEAAEPSDDGVIPLPSGEGNIPWEET